MNYPKVVLSTILLLAAPAALFVACDDAGISATKNRFEIHEWGVLTGEMNQTDHMITSLPPTDPFVREPVIYVHSETREPFHVEVTFNTGAPTLTYPPADTAANTLSWSEVSFSSAVGQTFPEVGSELAPPRPIAEMLGNVDSDMLSFGEYDLRFLFYEGNVTYSNQVEAAYDLESMTATVTNLTYYPVFDVVVVVAVPGAGPRDPGYASRVIEVLSPGQAVTVGLLDDKYPNWSSQLVEGGFTAMEADAFQMLWGQPFLNPRWSGHKANLVYRIPRDIYDGLIALKVTPQPTRTIRTLYILMQVL